MGQVVQGTDTYVPDVVQLPTLLMCREISVAVDKSLLELKGLPRSMLNGMPFDLSIAIQRPDMVTMSLIVSDGTHPTYFGLTFQR